jgi:hypothetical protein
MVLKKDGEDRVKNGVLQRVKEEMNILHTLQRRKSNRVGHMLRRNCLRENTLLKEDGRKDGN